MVLDLTRLFRHANPEEPLLFVYRDSPCVVIGRNQNPWTEVNLQALKEKTIPFIRRRSGGGTVYHDLGNTNYSIHTRRQDFDRKFTGSIALRAVQSLGIDARLNERNDICVGEEKVSGSAYKIANKRAYHHGTMLLSTHLGNLGELLRSKKDTIVTKGVSSVRSPVCNLQQYNPTVTHELFTQAVIRQFRDTFQIHEEAEYITEEDLIEVPYVKKGMAELPAWDWAYGQTPEFTHTVKETFTWGHITAEIVAKHGVILSCKLDISNSTLTNLSGDLLNRLGQRLKGQKYGFIGLEDWGPVDGLEEREIQEWLVRVMQD